MRVLLVNTNRMKPAIAPIGLDYLADAVVDAGHEAWLLDLCFSQDVESDIAAGTRQFGPDVIGVTIRNTDDCYFSGGAFFVPEIKKMVEAIRAASNVPVVLGGVGFSVAPEAVLEFVGGNYGIAGPGEHSFVRLLAALDSRLGLESVPSLLYRDGDAILRNPGNASLAEAHFPRRRQLPDNARYFREGGQIGFETKRGCNMNCIYCAEPGAKGRRVHLRPPAMIADEVKRLVAQGIDHFHTCDCEFNIPGNHAKDVCRAIVAADLGEKIRWYAYCSIVPFDAEMAGLMRAAGCVGIDFGADSANDEMLRRLGHDFASDDLKRTADLCHEHGIVFMYDLLVGSIGETRETIQETIDFMRAIDADCVGVSMGVRLYEDTQIARNVLAQGDISANPGVYGAKTDNPHFLKPVHYVSPAVGADIVDYLYELVGGDSRFFLPSNKRADSNYNYNDNSILVDAIRGGARGAYWDILRRMR